MRTVDQRLRHSRSALGRQGALLVTRWRRAAADFATSTSEAATHFGRFLVGESRAWSGYVRERVPVAGGSWRQARIAPMERELLVGLGRLLTLFARRVEERVARLGAPTATGQAQGVELPLAGYDALTARDIVAQVGDLSPAECRTLRDFEQRNKRRATVIRALGERIAA